MFYFICPVCGKNLVCAGKACRCENNHSFDISKEGHINLLLGSRSCDNVGDSAEMAVSRRSFLSKGYFDTLSDELVKIASTHGDVKTVLDICCGEGHYSSFFKNAVPNADVLGFDLSREMVKRAAKQNKNVGYAVANMTSIPVADNSTDFAFHLFAPFYESEFNRILSDNGILVSVIAGEKHLVELKNLLYDKPYLNEIKDPSCGKMTLVRDYDVSDTMHIGSSDDIKSLFMMTPYFYHTPSDAKEKLFAENELDVTLSFHIFIYQKTKGG